MLFLASSVCGLFKRRQFEPEVILLAVGWYLRFSLSYRDVEELLAERGLHADHVTAYQHRQGRRPSCGSKKVPLPRIANTAPYNISIMFWNRTTGLSNAECALAKVFVPFGLLGARSPVTRPSI